MREFQVFLEPQETTDVESVLYDYATACHTSVCCIAEHCTSRSDVKQNSSADTGTNSGALLFAVIGAKLSEGLNFSDDLARAVVIIGLPFANLGSPELQERMKYVNRLENNSSIQRRSGQKDAASELYENMCMNAVNQSIGEFPSLFPLGERIIKLSCRPSNPTSRGLGITHTD